MKPSAIRRTTARTGVISQAKVWIGRLWKVAKPTLLRIARLLGVISPTSSNRGTMISRLTHFLSAPRMSMTIAAEITEAETLTSSLPMRMVMISRRGSCSR